LSRLCLKGEGLFLLVSCSSPFFSLRFCERFADGDFVRPLSPLFSCGSKSRRLDVPIEIKLILPLVSIWRTLSQVPSFPHFPLSARQRLDDRAYVSSRGRESAAHPAFFAEFLPFLKHPPPLPPSLRAFLGFGS